MGFFFAVQKGDSGLPEPMSPPSSEVIRPPELLRTLARFLPVALILFGIALRLAGYFAHRSLWGDEVSIALNLRFRSFFGLFHHLDYEQTMPIPLLLAVKSLTTLFGFSEYVLRFLPLLAGCVLMVVTWPIFSRLFDQRIALISLGLMAVYRPLIYYSSELKQYGLDTLVTVVTLWLGLTVLQDEENSAWPRLILWGAIAVLLSQPSIFVLAAVGIAVAMDRRLLTSKQWRAYCASASVIWLMLFAGLFWFSYRPASRSPYMRAFWSSSFLYPAAPHFRQELSKALFTVAGGQSFNHLRLFILLLLFAVGLFGIFRNGGIKVLTVAAGPFLAIFAAAILKGYPIATRLVLFTAPLLFWIYASGVTTVADFFPQRLRMGAVIALSFGLFGLTAIASTRYAAHFPLREATRQLQQQMKSTDPTATVYLTFGKYTQWAYYAGDWSHPEILKKRIDSASNCLFSMQLSYMGFPKTDNCSDIANSEETKQGEIIGLPPSGPSEGLQKEDEWASSEAQRIIASHSGHVWLFVPIYSNNESFGYLLQRHLLEKLQEELEKRNAHLLGRRSVGDSIALQYELQSPGKATASFTQN